MTVQTEKCFTISLRISAARPPWSRRSISARFCREWQSAAAWNTGEETGDAAWARFTGQVNDNWPAPSWSSIDYFGRWKALHYMAKEFYARRAASLELNGSRIRLWAENETAENQAFRIQIYLKKMDFTVAAEITTTGSVDAFSSVCGAEIDLEDCRAYRKLKQDCAPDEDPDEALFIEGVVEYEDGTVRRSVETLLPYKYLRLTPPVFRTEVSRKGTAYEISLEADAFAAFVELSVDDADVIFSENYFHMTGRGQKVIILKDEDISGTAVKNEVDLAGRIRIRSVADTFE